MMTNPHREFKEVDGVKMTRFQYMKLPEMTFEWSDWKAEDGTRFWLVGINKADEGLSWEFKGLFSSEELAQQSAAEDQRCFIFSVVLDRDLGIERVPAADGYYPNPPEDWTYGPEYQ